MLPTVIIVKIECGYFTHIAHFMPKSQLDDFYGYEMHITAFLAVSKPVLNSSYRQLRLICDRLDIDIFAMFIEGSNRN